MGLDDFSSGDTSSSGSSSTDNKKEDDTSSDVDDNFTQKEPENYGKKDFTTKPDYLKREGPIVPLKMSALVQSSEDVIVRDNDEVKFHAPIFPLVCLNEEYETGKRYRMEYSGDMNSTPWDGRVVTCFGGLDTQLGNMTKEQAMFETGTASRSGVMDEFMSRFGDGIDAETEVTVYFFGDTLHLRDLAQANDVYREGEKINRDKLVQRVLHPNLLKVSLEERTEDN